MPVSTWFVCHKDTPTEGAYIACDSELTAVLFFAADRKLDPNVELDAYLHDPVKNREFVDPTKLSALRATKKTTYRMPVTRGTRTAEVKR